MTARRCRRHGQAWPLLAPALASLLLLSPPLVAADAPLPAQEPGWHRELVFDSYSPLAAKWAFADRVFAPTVVDRLRRFEAASGTVAVEHTVDLAEEHFDLFVPRRRPDAGYGVLVFVSPMPDFPLPRDWHAELNRRGLVFVTARRSGNAQNAFERRMPLALHGLAEVQARMPVDATRVYVAGFSGGARVAERMALAWPDVFNGVVLFASSDPIGKDGLVPPAAPLMRRFQRHSRVVFATGSSDLPNRNLDRITRASLSAYCVANVHTVVPRIGHWVPDRRGLGRALDALESAPVADAGTDACIQRLEADAEAGLATVDALLADGKAEEAGERLGALEDRFGGLLAPRSVELATRIAALLGG